MGVYDIEVYYPSEPRDAERDIEEMLGYPVGQESPANPDGFTKFIDSSIERPVAFFRRDGELVGYERDNFGIWREVNPDDFGTLLGERQDGGE